jgi:hypothetical protein
MAGMKPKTKVFQVEDLDPATKQALDALLKDRARPGAADDLPDAFTYTFHSDEAGAPNKEVEVTSTRVPEALRKLLP